MRICLEDMRDFARVIFSLDRECDSNDCSRIICPTHMVEYRSCVHCALYVYSLVIAAQCGKCGEMALCLTYHVIDDLGRLD